MHSFEFVVHIGKLRLLGFAGEDQGQTSTGGAD